MNILMSNYSEITTPGGIHRTINEISKNLSKKGHDITLLQGNPIGLPNEEKKNGFKIIRTKSTFADKLYGLSPDVFFYLKKNIKELNPDIVHIHDYNSLFSMELIYLIRKLDSEVPIIFSPHLGIFSHDTFAGKYFWWFYNRLMRSSILKIPDIIISSSNYEANNLYNCLKINNEKIRIIPHGIDYILPREELKFRKEKKKDLINILYLGYLLDFKGVQYILEAVGELVYKKKAKVFLTIVGEGSYEEELKSLVERLGIAEFVGFKRFVDPSESEKIMEFYKNSDVFLLLSKDENYGIVVPEALAMGTPVIVTKKTALKEFIDGKSCFGVEYPPKKEEVADLIIKIYENNIEIDPYKNPKIRTWDIVSEDYEKIYIDLLRV